eukprot:ANDGO_02572.mRNA.1 hypothetical protein
MRFLCELSPVDLLEHPSYEGLCEFAHQKLGADASVEVSLQLEDVRVLEPFGAPHSSEEEAGISKRAGSAANPQKTTEGQCPRPPAKSYCTRNNMPFLYDMFNRVPVRFVFSVVLTHAAAKSTLSQGYPDSISASPSEESISTIVSSDESGSLSSATDSRPHPHLHEHHVRIDTSAPTVINRDHARRRSSSSSQLTVSASLPDLGIVQQASRRADFDNNDSRNHNASAHALLLSSKAKTTAVEMHKQGEPTVGYCPPPGTDASVSRSVSSSKLTDISGVGKRHVSICILGDQMISVERGLERCSRLVDLLKEAMADRFIIHEKHVLLRHKDLASFSYVRHPLLREAHLILICSRSAEMVSPGNDIGAAVVECFRHRHIQDRLFILCPNLHSSKDDVCTDGLLRPTVAASKMCTGFDAVHSLFRKLDDANRLFGLNRDAGEDWSPMHVAVLSKCVVKNILFSATPDSSPPLRL